VIEIIPWTVVPTTTDAAQRNDLTKERLEATKMVIKMRGPAAQDPRSIVQTCPLRSRWGFIQPLYGRLQPQSTYEIELEMGVSVTID